MSSVRFSAVRYTFFILLSSSCISYACSKSHGADIQESLKTDSIINNGSKPIEPEKPATPPPTPNIRTILVGKGSGDLTIDGESMTADNQKITLTKNDVIKIKSGSYNSITIKNISIPDGRVTITNDGLVELNGDFKAMYLSNLNNVTISGDGAKENDRGFVFRNNKYRAVVMSNAINNFTFQYAMFKNINDYVISYIEGHKNVVYDGSPDSYSSNLAFLNLDSENIGPLLFLEGEINSSNFTGLIKGIEIAGITCINSPDISTVVFLGSSEGFNIHDNFVNNINMQNNNHNGIFAIRGSGKFYNNTVKNHQGNAIRAWIYSVDKQASVEIYNNKVYNSRKYSAFELQVTPPMKASSVFKPANAKVYNNTVGKMNTEKASFPGRVLDLYNTWSTLEIYNNLYFDNNDDLLINNNSDVTIIKNQNNIYKEKYSDAVSDLDNFSSKLSGIGAK
ncbi:MAG: hypothetical protein QM727_14165 [Niabella sp.]